MPSNNEMLRKANVLGEDMENSSLFTMGNMHGIKTGAIMTVDCDVFVEKEEEYDPYCRAMGDGVAIMCQLSLDAIIDVSLDTSIQFSFP